MRKLLPCLCLLLICVGTSFGQDDYPKLDAAVGFTFNHLETPAPTHRENLIGFTVAGAANFRRSWAVEGDLTYTRKGIGGGLQRELLTYLVGPRFTKRYDNKMEPFLHALIGGGNLSGFARPNTKGWAGKFGGGLDIIAGKHVAIRAFQVDYYRYHGHIPGGRQRLDNFAFTFGVRIF